MKRKFAIDTLDETKNTPGSIYRAGGPSPQKIRQAMAVGSLHYYLVGNRQYTSRDSVKKWMGVE